MKKEENIPESLETKKLIRQHEKPLPMVDSEAKP